MTAIGSAEVTIVFDTRRAIDDAIRGVAKIGPAFEAEGRRGEVAFESALEVLRTPTPVAVDAEPVTTAIDAAVEAADTSIVPDDTSAITTGIDEAVAAADGAVPVEPDGEESITTAIDGAVAAADGSVPVEPVGEGAITEAIDDAVNAADTTVEISGDTSDLNAELDSTSASAKGATESLEGTGSALGVVQGTSQLAAGDLAGVGATLGSVSARGSAAAGVFLAIAAAAGVTIGAALESETAQRRYNDVLGEFADRVANPAIEGFADTLEELAEKTGNSDESLKLAAARLFDLGRSSGVAGAQVAGTTEQVVLLATRASVLNPTLGDAGALTEALTGALARGGRTLNDYGISLTAAEIEQRALADSGKQTTEELTQFDRAAAGAAIATERLGDKLRTDIVAGAQQPAIELRRLREEFGNTVETFGLPLLGPLVAAAKAAQPVLLGLAEIFSSLAQAGLPLLVTALSAAGPVIGTVVSTVDLLAKALAPAVALIDAIPEPVLTAVVALIAVKAALGPLSTLVDKVAVGAFSAAGAIGGGGLGAAFRALVSPVGLVTAGLALTVSLIARHNEEQKRQREELEKGRKAFLDSAEATEKFIASQVQSRIESKNQTDDLTRVGLTVERFTHLLQLGRTGLEGFADTLVRTGEIERFAADQLLGLNKLTGDQARAVRNREAGNTGLLKSAIALSEGFERQSKAALDTLVSEGKLTSGTVRAIEVLTRRKDGTTDYAAAVKDANALLERQATAEIAAGRATEEARLKSAALATQYEALGEALKATTEGTTASETALARYGPALGAAVDQYVRGKPSIEAMAAIQNQFGIDTELLTGVIDDHIKKLADAKAANEAFVRAGVEGLTSITEASKVLDEDTSFQKYLDRLRKTALEQVAFTDNVAKLIARGADDIAKNILEQGPIAAGFAAELTRAGDKRLRAQETQLEQTKGLFAQSEATQAANGQALVTIQTQTNVALGAVPGPNLAAPMAASVDKAKSTLLTGLADVQRQALLGGTGIGRDFEVGVATGIGEAAINAHLAAEAVVEETRRRARAKAKATSPSQVFADLGRDMVAGLVVGLRETRDLRAAVDALALSAVPSLRSTAVTVAVSGSPSGQAQTQGVGVVPTVTTVPGVSSDSSGLTLNVAPGASLVTTVLPAGASPDLVRLLPQLKREMDAQLRHTLAEVRRNMTVGAGRF